MEADLCMSSDRSSTLFQLDLILWSCELLLDFSNSPRPMLEMHFLATKTSILVDPSRCPNLEQANPLASL
jgi:hypothetical protein